MEPNTLYNKHHYYHYVCKIWRFIREEDMTVLFKVGTESNISNGLNLLLY